MHLPQDQHLPVLGRKRLKPRFNLLAKLSALCRLLGGRGGVRHIQIQLLVIQGGAGSRPAPPLAAQQIHTGVGGQAVQPGGKAGFSPKGCKPLPGREKCLLRGLGRVLRIAAHAPCQRQDPLFIEVDQRLEGRLIAALGGLHPLLFLYVLHVRSLLIPFVTRYTSSRVFICTICSL